ncbi:unnamed protein product, partial [Iphiclides podalirius]
MKPYRRSNKALMVEFKSATRLGKLKVLVKEFACDVRALWHYGAPFPTFLKLIATLLLILLVLMPLLYPVFVVVATYFIFEGLFLSWWLDQPQRFSPVVIVKRTLSTILCTCPTRDMWKVREVFTRGILLVHSLATSVDYLCVMQGLLDEA